jgi:hypothetical protein
LNEDGNMDIPCADKGKSRSGVSTSNGYLVYEGKNSGLLPGIGCGKSTRLKLTDAKLKHERHLLQKKSTPVWFQM